MRGRRLSTVAALAAFAVILTLSPGDARDARDVRAVSEQTRQTTSPQRHALSSLHGWRVVHGHAARVGGSHARTTRSLIRLRWNGHGHDVRMISRTGARVAASRNRVYTGRMQVAARHGHRLARLQIREWRHGHLVRVTQGHRVRLGRHFRTLVVSSRPHAAGRRIGLALVIQHPRRKDRVVVGGASLSGRWSPRGGATHGRAPTDPGTPAGSTIGAFAIASNQEGVLGDTSKYAYIVTLGEAVRDHNLVEKAHRANPKTKVLLYLDPAVTRRRTCPSGQTFASYTAESFVVGVDYCWIKQNGHLDWILRDRAGNLAEYTDYDGLLPLDMANTAYQREFARNAVKVARAGGWDGIYLDDVNTVPGHGLSTLYRSGTAMSPSTYGNHTVGFMKNLPGLLSQLGGGSLLRAANVFTDPWTSTGTDQGLAIASTLDLYMREHQAQWLGDGGDCGPYQPMLPTDTTNFMKYARKVGDTGAHTAGVEYGGNGTAHDRQMMAFSRATWLLGWDGKPGSAFFFRPCGATDPADPIWTTELGTPTSAVRTLDEGSFVMPADPSWAQPAHVYRRDFTRGMVLLNEMPRSYTVPLDGTYRTSDGRTVSGSYTLPSGPANGLSGTAVLLTRVGS